MVVYLCGKKVRRPDCVICKASEGAAFSLAFNKVVRSSYKAKKRCWKLNKDEAMHCQFIVPHKKETHPL
jgi:hypothetical protein